MRRFLVLMAALAFAGTAAFAAERPNIVLLDAVQGALAYDSIAAGAFEAGIRDAFEPDFYLTEPTVSGARRVSMPLGNTFRLAHGEPFGDEWRVRLDISVDSLPRLFVRVAVRGPDPAVSGTRPAPLMEELSLDPPVEPRAAWFSNAGRAAGLLAVEALHRRSGDLAPDTRVRIDHAVRRPIKSMPSSAKP
jgi:hypothetical protein